jgi:signal transduction histidine kinase
MSLDLNDREVAGLLVEASRSVVLQSIASGITHSLRNAVQIAMMAGKSWGGETEPGEAAQGMEEISRGVESARRRLEETLRSSARWASRPVPILVPDLLQVVDDLQMAQRELPATRLRLDLPANLPPVGGNAGDIQLALLNLVTNAKEAMAPGAGSIHIVAGSDEGMVSLAVWDEGPGVSPGEEQRIFQPFATTKGGGRLGIGLPVARLLAQRHGGSVTLEPSPATRAGARFVMGVPVWRLR